MRSKVFKIRNISSQETNRFDIKRQTGSNLSQISEFGTGGGAAKTHFNQLVDMFKSFLRNSNQRKPQTLANAYDLQARDREVVVDPPKTEHEDGEISESQLKRWAARVVKTVSSAAFNYFSKNEMSFEQAKIYCSENIFRNVVILAQKSSLSAKQIQVIDKHIDENVLDYLQTKYPLTESTEINKKLQETVREMDNIESLENNYFTQTDIVFEYREDGNYNDLIMRMVNDLIGLVDKEVEPQKDNEVTNFDDFQSFMTGVFQKVQDEDWMRKQDKEQVINQIKMIYHMTVTEISDVKSTEQKPTELKQLKERLQRLNQEKEKYRTKVKQYTHYLIGRKIPQNAQMYTEKEIKNMNMTIKSPSVLRILTKWCGQLWQKYESGSYYNDRSESIKVQRGGHVNSLLAWMRKFLDERLRQQMLEIRKYMQELDENNYEMQSKLLQRQIERKDGGEEQLQELERIGGKFSLKIVKNLHAYIIAFLNRLIHGLLKAAKRLHDDNNLGNFSNWSSPANLLTFKVGDLMRCKCSSKQKEILRIYKELQRISRQTPQKLRIVRIKDRLRTGTNDILMNVKFNNSLLCQIQLTVQSHTSEFIKCSNLFNHYIYELKRSHFGPLTQLCSIWSSLDRKSQIYQQLLDSDDLKSDHIDHICRKLGKKYQMIKYQRPFVCGQCSRTYFHNNYLRSHACCNLCGFLQCANCKLSEENESTLMSSLITDPLLRKYCIKRVGESQQLPSLGICVLIQSRLPKAQIFTYISQQGAKKQYILGRENGQIYEIQSIAKQKLRHRFRSRYIIFELNLSEQFPPISHYQAKRQYILPTVIKKKYFKEKESISLMDQALITQDCKQILSVGTRTQKQTVKNLFLADNWLNGLPFDAEEFPNLRWITLSRNPIRNFAGLQKCQNLTNFIATSCGVETIPNEIYNIASLQKMSFSSNKITQVSDQIVNLQKLWHLQLDANALTSLPESLCQTPSLCCLNIEQNQIQSLPQNIYKLERLQTLLCNENRIKKLPERMGELKRLKQLDISSNCQLSVFPMSFYSLQNLQILDASKTAISCLPQSFGRLTSLKSIKFASCSHITTLPRSINQLKNLQKIDFSLCKQLQLPQYLWQATTLKNVNLSYCNISQIHSSFKQLANLQKIDLSGNQLAKMENDIFSNCGELIELIIENSDLQAFPDLYNCRKLVKLNLKNNKIAQVPNQFIANLTFLQQFKMGSNKLKRFPQSIEYLSKLVILDAEDNLITNIVNPTELQELKNSDVLVWPNLKYFQFANNQLTEIPSIVFKSLKLVYLNMSRNKVKDIPMQIGKLANLKQIILNYNQVQEIPVQLSQMKSLEGLHLQYNQIKVIPANLKKSATLKIFHVDGCPIETIQDPKWLINNGINCGQLYGMAYRLVNEKEEVQKQNKSNLNNLQGVQSLNNKNMEEKIITIIQQEISKIKGKTEHQNKQQRMQVSKAVKEYQDND